MLDTTPSGIITLMFTDIQGSTPLWEQMGGEFRWVLDRHNALVHEALEQWGGYEVKRQGDSFMIAFERASDALRCAVEIQSRMAQEQWPEEVGELLVRIGVHAGEAFRGLDADERPDYFGPMVNRAARIAEAGHGGQILASSAVRDIAQDAAGGDLQLVPLGRHRLRGLEQGEDLFEVRHPDLPARTLPPLRTLDTMSGNLLARLTSFVGRERELVELRELLAQPYMRLLTITGPAGCGKTHLAHEVALAAEALFPDGVWSVGLDDTDVPENVVPCIAAAVGLSLLGNEDPREQLLAFFSGRRLLLILDGFERAVGASLLVNDILQRAPLVTCLVTSQIALRLRSEQVYALQPMQVPEVGVTAPEHLLRFDSVALLLERARAARDDFHLTARNSAHVAELCRQLDGIPLALELASAQLAELSPAEVLEGVQARVDALWSDGPDMPARHRTLRAAIDWSYNLLSALDQQVLQRLSVFAGGFCREAAEAVCGSEGLPALHTLRHHSLVNTSETASGRTRYLLLGLIRMYAREKLEARPEVAAEAAERHARHYLGFGQQRLPLMRTGEEGRVLAELTAEADNLRRALRWAHEHALGELCAGLALVLYEPLYRQGLWRDAQWALQTAAAALERGGERSLASTRAAPSLALLRRKGLEGTVLPDLPANWPEELLPAHVEQLIGHLACRSPAMRVLREELAAAAETHEALLLTGPPGVGKRHMARVLHNSCGAGTGALVVQPLPAIRPAELEALAEDAAVATVLLTGLERLDAIKRPLQSALARVLAGAASTAARLVLTASCAADELLSDEKLSPELARALQSVRHLRVPPLAQRTADLPELAESLHRRAALQLGRSLRPLTDAVLGALGQALEAGALENEAAGLAELIERAVARATGEALAVRDLDLPLAAEYHALVRRHGQTEELHLSALAVAELEAEPGLQLLLYAERDADAWCVTRLRLEGQEQGVEDQRVGRLLCLLAARTGEVVQVRRHKRELGLLDHEPVRRYVFLLRRLLRDTSEGRQSRYITSQYGEAYSFNPDLAFALLRRLSPHDT